MSTPVSARIALRGALGDTGHRLGERQLGRKRRHRRLDPGIERGDVSVQRLDQREVLLEEKRVVRRETPHDRLSKGGPLLPDVALRVGREPVRIIDARAECLHDGPAGLAHDVRDDTAELDLGEFQRLGDAIDVMATLADERLPQPR
jgi:hypothetical protein